VDSYKKNRFLLSIHCGIGSETPFLVVENIPFDWQYVVIDCASAPFTRYFALHVIVMLSPNRNCCFDFGVMSPFTTLPGEGHAAKD